MSGETPVKAHLRISELSDVKDGDTTYYTFFFNSNDDASHKEDFEGRVVYIDRTGTVELKQGQILTLVFAEDVDFAEPEPPARSTRK